MHRLGTRRSHTSGWHLETNQYLGGGGGGGSSLKRTANRGPNAVSIVCLGNCWSTIRLRPDPFNMFARFFSASKFLYGSHCTMHYGKPQWAHLHRHFGLLEAFFRIVCDRPAWVARNIDESMFIFWPWEASCRRRSGRVLMNRHLVDRFVEGFLYTASDNHMTIGVVIKSGCGIVFPS